MRIFEKMASNANNTLNNEKAAAARKRLIKLGGIGAAVCFGLALALIVTGSFLIFYDTIFALGVVCMVFGGLSLIAFVVFLIMLLAGVFMAVGGAGVKVLDTTGVCPSCGTHLFSGDKNCPSCGMSRHIN